MNTQLIHKKKLSAILVPKVAFQAKWAALIGPGAGIVEQAFENGAYSVCFVGASGSSRTHAEYGDRIRGAFAGQGQSIKVPASEFEVIGFATDISVNFNDAPARLQWQAARTPMQVAA